MDLSEIIDTLKTTDAAEFADALQKDAQGHFQAIFRKGFGTAKSEYENEAGTGKLDTLKAQLDSFEQGKQALTTELTELRKKQPDLQKLQSEKEEALVAKEQEWKGKYEALQTQLIGGARESAKQRVVSALVANGVDPWAAARALDEPTLKRISPVLTEEGQVATKFYQVDGQTPYAPADGQDAAEIFATDLIRGKAIPEHLVKPERITTKNGAGPSGNGASGGGKLTLSSMTDAQKVEYAEAHGHDALRALPYE